MNSRIEVVSYDPDWPRLFEIEASQIRQALGRNCIDIHHIGSTSVPGLSAKPIIDMLPVVKNILEVDPAAKAMENLGYAAKGEYGIAFRRFFQKGIPVRTHNVHIYEEGDPEIGRYIKFRDWMRFHADDAQAYAKLKLDLADKYPDDILSYCMGKDAFVAQIDAKDGFKGWRIVQALTEREWNAVLNLRQQFFISSSDPFAPVSKEKEHIHFVFYTEVEIIGYIHLQLCSKETAALRVIVIDEQYRKRGYGSRFLKLCERWLSHQRIKKLQIRSIPTTLKFFSKRGFVPMPFDAPDGTETYPLDIEMGKIL